MKVKGVKGILVGPLLFAMSVVDFVECMIGSIIALYINDNQILYYHVNAF